MVYVWMAVGIAVLVAGGELLIRHSSRLAVSAGISPLVVGLTVVAFGTSAPEMITSVYGRLAGETSVAIGNVVGSNIFNVLLILGLSALAVPLVVAVKLLRWEVPMGVGVALLAAGFAYSGEIAKWEAGVLLAILVVYTVWLIRESREEPPEVVDEYDEVRGEGTDRWVGSVVLVLAGLGLLVFGGRTFVNAAVEVAHRLGIDDAVIGLTVVAAGTSLPELVTSALASLRGHRDIAVGNVVGSNLFNLTGVLGVTGLLGTGGLTVPSSVLRFDMPVLIATAILCLPIMFTGRRIDRWEGGIFVLYYIGYVTYLVLAATGHAAAPSFGIAMVAFVVPLTILTFAVIGYREFTGE